MLPKQKQKRKSKFRLDASKIRLLLVFLVVSAVFIIINKIFFFMGLFIIATFAGKMIRGQMGLKMVVLDPLLFSAIIITRYFGIKYLFLFLFITVFFADFVSGIFSPGSFANYLLYHLCPILSHLIFSKFSLMFYGNMASIFYSVGYFIVRTTILPDDPFQVISKSMTSVMFTFMYLLFLGPILNIILK
ncbi:hypothetical protein JW930_02465 [Candidatus Woesearchaeota archaeon]|nr:hypothetical protein [Candidatus Woesearchaeota archaeon]